MGDAGTEQGFLILMGTIEFQNNRGQMAMLNLKSKLGAVIIMSGKFRGSQGCVTHRQLEKWLIQHSILRDMIEQQTSVLLDLCNQKNK